MDRKVTIIRGELSEKAILKAQMYLYEISKQNSFKNTCEKEAMS